MLGYRVWVAISTALKTEVCVLCEKVRGAKKGLESWIYADSQIISGCRDKVLLGLE